MAKLELGSLILFGSTSGSKREDSFFQLDTVFVVGGYVDYDTSKPETLLKDPRVSKTYYNNVCQMGLPLENSLQLRLYFGATYQDNKEFYSFSPAKSYNDNEVGFPRIKLKDLDYITNNLNSSPKSKIVNIKDVATFWKQIRDISRDQGCVEAVQFDMPQKKKK